MGRGSCDRGILADVPHLPSVAVRQSLPGFSPLQDAPLAASASSRIQRSHPLPLLSLPAGGRGLVRSAVPMESREGLSSEGNRGAFRSEGRGGCLCERATEYGAVNINLRQEGGGRR